MGCDDRGRPSDAEYEEMEKERQKRIKKILAVVKDWIEGKVPGETLRLDRKYFSQYASEPDVRVHVENCLVSERVGR